MRMCIAVLTGIRFDGYHALGKELFLILNLMPPGWVVRETDLYLGLGQCGKLPLEGCGRVSGSQGELYVLRSGVWGWGGVGVGMTPVWVLGPRAGPGGPHHHLGPADFA